MKEYFDEHWIHYNKDNYLQPDEEKVQKRKENIIKRIRVKKGWKENQMKWYLERNKIEMVDWERTEGNINIIVSLRKNSCKDMGARNLMWQQKPSKIVVDQYINHLPMIISALHMATGVW